MMLVRFRLNGQIVEAQAAPNWTLLDFLRERFEMTSVKKGCDEGQCGACTVLLNGKPICSCLMLAVQVRDAKVTTVEGLSRPGELSAVQQAFLEKNGYQCGFCTPGILLAATALLDQNLDPSIEDIKEALEGNLCRCTGYEQIIESVSRAAEMMRTSAGA
jgi:carbon-monoxide dehydrogenase small subunit